MARRIVADAGMHWDDPVPGVTASLGELLLEPTLVYTPGVLHVLDTLPGVVHSASHITGGGIAQNLQRVVPPGVAVTLERGSWTLPSVFSSLAHHGGLSLEQVEDTWNLGMGAALIVEAGSGPDVVAALAEKGFGANAVARVEQSDGSSAESAKGVTGGLVSLTGQWAG